MNGQENTVKIFCRPYYNKHVVDQTVAFQVLRAIQSRNYKISGSENIVIDCPICKKEKHLYISVGNTRGLFICFHCNIRGKLDNDIILPQPIYTEKNLYIPDIHDVCPYPVDNFYTKEAYDYLIGRGLTDKQIEKLRTFVRRGEKRVFFPVYEGEKMVFATGRTFDSEELSPKYLDLGVKSLYSTLEDKDAEYVVICEGIFDALAIKNSVAILGLYMTVNQEIKFYELLEQFPKISKIVVCLDNIKCFEKIVLLYLKLSLYFKNVYGIGLPESIKDPWEGRHVINEIVEKVLSVSPGMYIINEDLSFEQFYV